MVLLTILICATAAVNAKTITFKPNPENMWNLDHSYYYSWGIKYNIPKGQQIVDAVLEFKNLNNWAKEDNILYVDLLDNPKSGTKSYVDSQKKGDAWEGKGLRIGTYTDKDYKKPETVTFSLKSCGLLDELNTYAKDGLFGIGLDPDCHYNNCGVKLTITTSSRAPETPEPSSLIAGLMGLGSFGLLKFRKR